MTSTSTKTRSWRAPRTLGNGGGREQPTRTFGTMTVDVLAPRDWLAAMGASLIGMKSTGVYWNPVVRHEAPIDSEVQELLQRAVAAAG